MTLPAPLVPAHLADDIAHYCWACRSPLEGFECYGDPPRRGRCPRCGAKPRHRAMLWYLSSVVAPRLAAGARVLEIGAARFAIEHFIDPRYIGDAHYLALDIRCLRHHRQVPAPHGFVQASATELPFGDHSFDLILCNNTLTYIPDDRAALREMCRCLKHDGMAMMQTHRFDTPTVTAAAYAAANPALEPGWFAENGDAWVYGPDFFERVHEAGLRSRVDLPLSGQTADFQTRFGIKPRTELIVAFCSDAGARRFPPP